MELSNDQQKVLDFVLQWYDSASKAQFITLGGYAGTGKTTLISILRKKLDTKNNKLKVAFVSFTGKASLVLKNNLINLQVMFPQDFVGTIHSLIYSPIVNTREEIIGWERKDDIKTDLIVVDEASMVDEEIWNDLLSYKIPILAVGDHGQLPPIRGKFNLMKEPNIKLETIFRQSEGNPIIKLSQLARETGRIPVGVYGQLVVKFNANDSDATNDFMDKLNNYQMDELILCGFNHTRVKLNKYIRNLKNIESETPVVGDKVICLRNNHVKGIFNGMLGVIKTLSSSGEHKMYAEIEMDNSSELFKGFIASDQFNNTSGLNFTEKRGHYNDVDLFDFGYALTVHKAQGSQAPKVILIEERFTKMDEEMWRRWLYTAVTRAQNELYILGR